MSKGKGLLGAMVHEVKEFDERYQISNDFKDTITRDELKLLYFGCALAGEAGEAANVIKKIVRDGSSPELINELQVEIIDNLIYIAEIVDILNMDVDSVWNLKMKILHERWSKRAVKDPKFVIVVGPDGSGKTTLVEGILGTLGTNWDIVKCTAPKDSREAIDTATDAINWHLNHPVNRIFDRFFIPDDLIYAPVVVGYDYTKDELEQVAEVEKKLKQLGAVIILVSAPIDVLRQRIDVRGDDYIRTDQLPAIVRAYDEYIYRTTLPYCRLDSTLPPEELVKKAITFIKEGVILE